MIKSLKPNWSIENEIVFDTLELYFIDNSDT